MSINGSILSYPERGTYGNNRYRGNCTGHIIKECLEFYKPKIFIDVMRGGGTSDDVVEELRENGWNIEYHGLDLKNGFNLLKNSIREKIGGKLADWIFCHPPYWNIVSYSGNMWGKEAHADDLSHAPSYEDFLTKLNTVFHNIYDALAPSGVYSILVGDVRKRGAYYPLGADIVQIAPGTLDGILIKTQHNCTSDGKKYSNSNFIPIRHEYLINIRKSSVSFGLLDATLNVSRRLERLARANWSATIRRALNELGGQAQLTEIYDYIETTLPEKTAPRPNWKARIRAELQKYFRSVERGVWAIA